MSLLDRPQELMPLSLKQMVLDTVFFCKIASKQKSMEQDGQRFAKTKYNYKNVHLKLVYLPTYLPSNM